jgi:hypothetical protein
MAQGRNVSVWYHPDELKMVEQAAVLAGYRKLSTYIRDRSLGRVRHDAGEAFQVDRWSDQQAAQVRLGEVEAAVKDVQALLAMQLSLLGKKASLGEIRDLLVACKGADNPSDVLRVMAPELASAVAHLQGDA